MSLFKDGEPPNASARWWWVKPDRERRRLANQLMYGGAVGWVLHLSIEVMTVDPEVTPHVAWVWALLAGFGISLRVAKKPDT